MLPISINILLAFNVIVCLLLILLTLMQRPKNEGLGAAFGGGMTDNIFGAETTNVLSKATRILGSIFFAVSLLLSILYTRLATSPSTVQAHLANKPIPAPEKAVKSPAPAKTEEAAKPAPAAPAKEVPAQATPVASPAPEATATPASAATPAPAASPAAAK